MVSQAAVAVHLPVELRVDVHARTLPLAVAVLLQNVALEELFALRALAEEARQAVLTLHLRR